MTADSVNVFKLNEAQCRVWDRADMKEAEGCRIERATESDYIHNQDE
jgi:hypothetical protein